MIYHLESGKRLKSKCPSMGEWEVELVSKCSVNRAKCFPCSTSLWGAITVQCARHIAHLWNIVIAFCSKINKLLIIISIRRIFFLYLIFKMFIKTITNHYSCETTNIITTVCCKLYVVSKEKLLNFYTPKKQLN